MLHMLKHSIFRTPQYFISWQSEAHENHLHLFQRRIKFIFLQNTRLPLLLINLDGLDPTGFSGISDICLSTASP